MTYNAHLLLHLVDSVREWGPLRAYSLYPFESMNGQLGKFVCGNRHAQVQILDRFTTLQALPTLWWQVAHNNGNACIAFSFKHLIRGYNLKKHCVQVGSVFLFGKGVKMGTATHYRKMKVGSFHFCVAGLDKSRRCNSYISSNGILGRIQDISVSCDDNHVNCHCCSRAVTVTVDVLREKSRVLGVVCKDSGIKFVEVEPFGSTCAVSAESVGKCVVVQDGTKTFLFSLSEHLALEAT